MSDMERWSRPGSDDLPALTGLGSQAALEQRGVALCGSRGVGELGIAMASAVGKLAAELELPLVSGYAKGADMAGHVACVEAGGHTIAVLAEGLSDTFRVRPELQSAVEPWDNIWDKLTVVSEFESNERWIVWRAMNRNATICALSDVLVAIDPGEKGGTLDAIKKGVKRDMPVIIGWTDSDPEPAHLQKLLAKPNVSLVSDIPDLLAAVERALEPDSALEPAPQLSLPL